jgi:hypothetical protein
MLRNTIIRPAATANRALLTRSFSIAAPRMGEGDTGAPRSGGVAAGFVIPLLTPPLHRVPCYSQLVCALKACMVAEHGVSALW